MSRRLSSTLRKYTSTRYGAVANTLLANESLAVLFGRLALANVARILGNVIRSIRKLLRIQNSLDNVVLQLFLSMASE